MKNRYLINKHYKTILSSKKKKFLSNQTSIENFNSLISTIGKLKQKGIIHKNKAARLMSKHSKLKKANEGK